MEHFAIKLQAYLWFLQFLKVEWEAEPSAFRLLSCGSDSQPAFRRLTPSLILRLDLKLPFFLKIVGVFSLTP